MSDENNLTYASDRRSCNLLLCFILPLLLLLQLHFMICLAANYTRIRISKELTEYRDAVDMEEFELNSGVEKSSTQY